MMFKMETGKTFGEMCKDVHQNAVEHGWWETERDISETYALINSEWSEALEEARAGRPLVWMDEANHGKPEGIAVELIDGCIRIMDLLGRDFTEAELDNVWVGYTRAHDGVEKTTLPQLVMSMEQYTVYAYENAYTAEMEQNRTDPKLLCGIIKDVFSWTNGNGKSMGMKLIPEELLLQKHEYNKGRPYKHGKRF